MTGEAAIRINENSVIRESIYGKRIRSTDVILTGIIYGCASLSMLLLIGILGYTFVRGVPHVTWSFLSTVSSATKGTFGILGNIINTLYIVVITLLIATPIGVGSAVYLNEYAKPGKIVRLIVFTTETGSYDDRDTVRYSFYYIWSFRNGIFRKYTGTGLLHSYRFPDTDFNDPSTDHKNHPGSIKDRS